MLPDLSKIKTISVGLLTISGEAVKDRVTLNVLLHVILVALTCLLEFVIPILSIPF